MDRRRQGRGLCGALAAGALIVLGWLMPGAGAAQTGAERLGQLLLGNYVFTLFHEIGHALIHELNLPVVGIEEDAVDEFAAIALISMAQQPGLPADQQAAMQQMVVDAAVGFAALWELKQRQAGGDLTRLPYWDEHGLDIKRFYNIICLFAGSDPARFGEVARRTGMPDERIARCERDYRAKDAAWERLLTPHLRTPSTPAGAGPVTVAYGQATTPFSQQLERDLRQRGILEAVAELLQETFVLPRGLRLVAGECGEPNAFYSPNEGRVIMCHELVAFLRELFTASAGPAGPQRPPAGPTPPRAPMPGPAGPMPPMPGPIAPGPAAPVPPGVDPAALERYLVGSWAGSYVDPSSGHPVQVQLVIAPGRRFTQLSYNPWTGLAIRIWGTFVVIGNGIRTQVEGYEPDRFCGPTGHCVPILIPMSETVPIRVLDAATMETAVGILRRAG